MPKTMNKKQTLTNYGQTIIETLCDEVAKHERYRKAELDKTANVVAWLAKKLGRSVRSVAGAVADLIEKDYLSNAWQRIERQGDTDIASDSQEISITSKGWQAWAKFDEAECLELCPYYAESLEDWIEWDGLDGSEIGYEDELIEKKVFRS